MEETCSIAPFSVSFVAFVPLWSIDEQALEKTSTTKAQRTQGNETSPAYHSFLGFLSVLCDLRAFVVKPAFVV